MTTEDKASSKAPLAREAKDHDDRRDAQRRSVLWPAILHIGDHHFNCQIRNFSLSGLKLKFNLPLKEGTAIKVEIPKHGIVLRAEISWQSDDLLGLRFLERPEIIKDTFGEHAAVMGIGVKELFEALKNTPGA
jgi:hypothetical protein